MPQGGVSSVRVDVDRRRRLGRARLHAVLETAIVVVVVGARVPARRANGRGRGRAVFAVGVDAPRRSRRRGGRAPVPARLARGAADARTVRALCLSAARVDGSHDRQGPRQRERRSGASQTPKIRAALRGLLRRPRRQRRARHGGRSVLHVVATSSPSPRAAHRRVLRGAERWLGPRRRRLYAQPPLHAPASPGHARPLPHRARLSWQRRPRLCVCFYSTSSEHDDDDDGEVQEEEDDNEEQPTKATTASSA
mmetsp:Transcript_19556/g.60440  ORF Transcript_19556/g.60440 Transcript_19556/m.60440 type:complete len:252 (-) Transcript_19556:38-793(-)